MKKYKSIIACLLLAVICGVVTVGCGSQQTGEASATQEVTKPGKIPTVQRMSDLERNQFYVETNEGYAKPFWPTLNFSPNIGGTDVGASKVCWFSDDTWQQIPTVYKGQRVVFRTDADFNESFSFTKFLDDGWSFGICGLQPTSTGRYKLKAVPDNTTQINPWSDAAKLVNYNANVVLEGVYNEKLRSDRVDSCGIITGLEKGKSYDVELYIGTEIQDCTLKVDSHILHGAQGYTTSEYEYIQAEIIIINIPDWFKSGYYSINGYGLFRYVAGDSYDENTNFNELNAESGAAAAVIDDLPHQKVDWTDNVEFLVPGKYRVTIVYDDNINETLIPEGYTAETIYAPTVYLNTGDETITYLINKGNHVLEGEYDIMVPGLYPMEMKDLFGRGYKFSMQILEEYPAQPIGEDG